MDAAGSGQKRTTEDVIRDHLDNRANARLERDIARNYHPELVLLHGNGVERGHDGIRKSAERLQQQLPGMCFEVISLQIEGEYVYLEWRARSDHHTVSDGADSFVVREGRIMMQSIHYTLREPPESPRREHGQDNRPEDQER